MIGSPPETLFAITRPAPTAPKSAMIDWAYLMAMPFDGGYSLRDYQREDVLAGLQALSTGKRGVVFREATGLGKSVIVAELSRRLSRAGRVLVLVDVTNLADDLSGSCQKHTGENVGVLTGTLKEAWRGSKIVVATVQSMYSGSEGGERYRDFDPTEFVAVLVDECETSIADSYSGVIRYFLDGNPSLVIAGLSATPFRTDGRGMGELYDHAENEPGPLNRNVLWGRDNGWLVHVRQAFVRVSIDFSTLELRKNKEGVKDYSDEALAKAFDESKLIELAQGIHGVAKGEPSIVICPNDTAIADALAGYLDGAAGENGFARSVHGKQGKRANDHIAAFKRGDYPYIVSVNKLYKGFDADRVKFVFMCRKTRSARIYEQSLGRGTRPLIAIRAALEAAVSPEARRLVVAESAKPYMVMVDLVGIDESTKDIGVIDILGESLPEDVRERTKRDLLKDDAEDEEVATGEGKDAEAAARKAEKDLAEETRLREEEEQKRRSMVQVKADVQVEYSDDLRSSGGNHHNGASATAPARVLAQLRKFKVPEKTIATMAPQALIDLNKQLLIRSKNGLCSFGQANVLKRMGYSKDELRVMPRGAASVAIEAAKANGWKRPANDVSHLVGAMDGVL